MDWWEHADIKVWHLPKFQKINIEILANTAITFVLKTLKQNAAYLKLKISKQRKLTILVITTWLDDVKLKTPSFVVLYSTKCNTYCHEMFHTSWAISKTLKKKIDKTMENHITQTLQFESNFLELEYTSEIYISFYIKRNGP